MIGILYVDDEQILKANQDTDRINKTGRETKMEEPQSACFACDGYFQRIEFNGGLMPTTKGE